MRIKKSWIAALPAALIAVGLTVSPGHADPDSATIFGGFESAAAVSSVTVSNPSLDRVQFSPDVVSAGTHSLELDVGAGTGTAQIDLHSGSSFDPATWSDHALITWDVMSDSPVQFLGRVTFKDTSGHSWGHAYYIPAFGIHSYDGLVSDIAAGGVDVDHISEIDLSAPRQQWPVRVWIDSLRLDVRTEDHTPYINTATPGLIQQMRLGPRIDDQQTALNAAARQIPPTGTDADNALRAQVQSLSTTLTTMQQQAAQPGLTLTTAQGLNQQLQTVSGNIQRLGDITAARRADPANTQYGVTTADSASLIYPQDRPCACSTSPPPLELARGEDQSEQVAVIPYAADLPGVSVKVGSITGPDRRGGALTATAAPVGFLNVTPTASYNSTKDTSGWYTGWTPDPIRDDITRVDVPAGTFQPYWITVHAGAQTPAGHYRVRVVISGSNVRTTTVALTVEVWPFILPERPDLTTSFEFQPSVLPQLYGITDPAQVTAKTRQYEDFLESYKMEPGNVYAATPPTVGDLEYIKNKWGLKHFNVIYLNYTLIDINDPSSWQKQIDSWVATISTAMAQYKAAGLDKYAYVYGFDERPASWYPVIKQTLTAIKAKFPDLPVMSTVRDNTMGPGSGLTGLVNIWSPQMDLYQQASADAAHARGDQAYWYPDIATGHPYPNWFNGYPPIDTRMMMGPMSHQSGVDGVLYYNVDRWVNHPLLEDGIYSAWNPATLDTTAGDGSLFYPGKDGPLPSIRLANFRDGMQDYNLLDLLSARIADPPHGTSAAEIARAKALLGAQAVVRSDTDYTEDTATYRQWRSEVAQEIVRLTH